MRHFGVQMASTSTYISNRKKCVHAKLCVHFPGCSSVTFLMRRNTNQWPCWERKCFFNSYIWFSQDFQVYSFFTSFEEPFCVLKIKTEGTDTLLDRAFEPLPDEAAAVQRLWGRSRSLSVHLVEGTDWKSTQHGDCHNCRGKLEHREETRADSGIWQGQYANLHREISSRGRYCLEATALTTTALCRWPAGTVSPDERCSFFQN